MIIGGHRRGASDNATIDAATIDAALNAGTSVTINTGSVGVQPGNITVASAIAKSAGGAVSLSLQAAGSIDVEAPISSSVGALSVTLSTVNSAIVVNSGITTNGGTFEALTPFGSSGASFTLAAGASISTGTGTLGIFNGGS